MALGDHITTHQLVNTNGYTGLSAIDITLYWLGEGGAAFARECFKRTILLVIVELHGDQTFTSLCLWEADFDPPGLSTGRISTHKAKGAYSDFSEIHVPKNPTNTGIRLHYNTS